MTTSSLIFVCVALGGAALGLLEFGVGALLWAEEKFLMAIGLLAALGGIYIGLWVIHLLITQPL